MTATLDPGQQDRAYEELRKRSLFRWIFLTNEARKQELLFESLRKRHVREVQRTLVERIRQRQEMN